MRIISSLLLMLCLPVAVTATEKPPSLATQLADHYLKSFGQAVSPLASPTKEDNRLHTNITDIHLSPRAERAVVFNEIFVKSDAYQAHYKEAGKLLNPYAWNDLHLFCGTTATPAYHFLSRINKTITVLGEGALASLIGVPIANLEQLTKRQQLIAFLCQNTQVYSNLKSALQHYKPSEKAMLSFWTEIDPLYTKEYDKYLTKLFYTRSAASNKLTGLLQSRKLLLRDSWDIYWKVVSPFSLGLIASELVYHIQDGEKSRGPVYKTVFPSFVPFYAFYHINKHEKLGQKGIHYFNATTLSLFYSFECYKSYSNYKEYSGVLKNLALRMADLQTFLLTAKETNELAEQNPELAALYSKQMQSISALLARLNESSEVGNLLRYLESLPLRSWSYLWSNAGKLLASYKLFVEHKAVFHDAMYGLRGVRCLF